MNRRSFFKFGLPAVAGVALSEAIPFGRVWSFPSKITIANLEDAYNATQGQAEPDCIYLDTMPWWMVTPLKDYRVTWTLDGRPVFPIDGSDEWIDVTQLPDIQVPAPKDATMIRGTNG